MDSIVWLNQIDLEDRARVGGKAAVLGALRRAGLPVPDGFCIPRQAAGQDSDAFWSAVARAYARLAPDGSAVAVRSSGVFEDMAESSFAGQYETLLDVRGEAALRSAVERCWGSARSRRARAYQARKGKVERALPVLVQRQIPATASGVLFTADPVSGYARQMLIEAVAGLGEPLVSGRATPARYRVDRKYGVQALSATRILTKSQCRRLARLGVKVEECLGKGGGYDIEWALVGDDPYVLQARPITGDTTKVSLSQVWTRANIGEVLPHVVTPLTWAVFRATLLHDPALALRTVDGPEDPEEGIRRILGRAYIRLDSLLDAFCYLPMVKPVVMSRVLGVELPVVSEAYDPPAGLSVRLAQGAFWLDALGLLPHLSRLVRQQSPLPTARDPVDPMQASGRLAVLLRWTSDCFRLHLKCTAYAIGAFGVLTHLLARWLPAEAETLLPQLLIGREDLQTAAQGVSLRHLAEQVRESQALVDILEAELDWPGMAQRMPGLPGGSEFVAAMEAFLAANGARAVGEFELAMPRWNENPSFVLDVLRKFLEATPGELSNGDPADRRELQSAAVERINGSLGPLRSWLFTRLLASYSVYATLRENVKYRLMEGYALLREMFLDIGAMLTTRGLLSSATDVFFLTPAELLGLLARDESDWQIVGLVAARRADHAQWESQQAPDLVVGEGLESFSPEIDGLTGIGCSPGTAKGVARVLYDISEAGSLRPGEILVAPHTDPGWTPLFLSCRAVVTEIGGFLSHGATVAREYGIPAVVNVKGATARIQTGDLICVDGASGRIVISYRKNGS